MLIETQTQNWAGDHCQLTGNEPLLLDHSDAIYLIKSGKMALFAVTPQRKRRYLCSFVSGMARFGRSPISSTSQQLLAVSLETTELFKISRSTFLRTKQSETISLIENWVNQLGNILSDLTPSLCPTYPKGIHYGSLMPNEIFQPQAIVWVRLQQGSAKWMGHEEFPITPGDTIPLSSHLWIQAQDRIDFEQFCTSEIAPAALWTSLDQLQTQLLKFVNLLDQQTDQQELMRFQEQERTDQRVVAETLGELVSVL